MLPLIIIAGGATVAAAYGLNYGGHALACDNVLGRTVTSSTLGIGGGTFVGYGCALASADVVTRLVGATAGSIDANQAKGSFEDAFWRENKPKAIGYGCALLVGSAVMGNLDSCIGTALS